jgi:hypothetical protein
MSSKDMFKFCYPFKNGISPDSTSLSLFLAEEFIPNLSYSDYCILSSPDSYSLLLKLVYMELRLVLTFGGSPMMSKLGIFNLGILNSIYSSDSFANLNGGVS